MQPDDEDEDETIQRQNRMTLLFVAVLTGLSIWLVNVYSDHLKLQLCIESGRHNCLPPLDLEPK